MNARKSTTLDWLRLALAPEIGPTIAAKLIEEFGSPGALFAGGSDAASKIGGMGPKRLEGLFSAETIERAGKEVERAQELGIRIITRDADDYPRSLAAIPNAPLVLYMQGELKPEDHIALAVVGPRKPSDYARIMTANLVPPLCARGIVIVSGMAHGVDAEAHKAALDCGGRTIAVLAQGLDTSIYPAANKKIVGRIVGGKCGAVLTAFPFGAGPEAGHFPQRNAIVAGLSLAALIIEAGEKSGALLTAGHAAEFNRPVLACPGDATRKNAFGSNRLLIDGAALIQTSDDVLNALASELRTARETLGQSEVVEAASNDSVTTIIAPSDYRPSHPIESLVLELLENEYRTLDYLLAECANVGIGHGDLVSRLLQMELAGAVRQMPGRVYARLV